MLIVSLVSKYGVLIEELNAVHVESLATHSPIYASISSDVASIWQGRFCLLYKYCNVCFALKIKT